MYYYRQFFTQESRGQKQTVPFFNGAKRVLEDYNDGLPQPESLGLLLELENPQLAARYNMAQGPQTTFIGYSPRGFQMRVSYFEHATLLEPAVLAKGSVAATPRRAAR